MSLHNKPFTDLEKNGLIEHGFKPRDKPSKLSDVAQQGMEWALKEGLKAGKWKDGGDSMAGAMAGM